MVDFNKLRKKQKKEKAIQPRDIFRRLPKPPGINDLYTSQAEVLDAWYSRRSDRDVVIKLHTGGGKTLVGLLIAQSTLNETNEPVLYLAPTTQLVKQTLEKARALGIHAVPYKTGQSLDDNFVNSNSIMVGTYKALFNGRSKFGVRGASRPQNVSAVILDDAHAAFSVVRESFTLSVDDKKERDLYESLTGLFRKSFKDTDRVGTFDDIVAGSEYSVLEVPYWAWHEQLETVREILRAKADKFGLVWPLLRDNLHLCHALVSRKEFSITPVLPLVNAFPTFFDSPRRIYMSATIADDSDIVSTFDANPDLVQSAITSRSLAGISERMVLMPDLMPFQLDVQGAIKKIVQWTSKGSLGSVILTPSDNAAEKWKDVAAVAKGSGDVDKYVDNLQKSATSGPVVFANRYDGIDLPGDSCRLLVMSGLPTGTSSYELFRASALYGGATITRLLAQRIEQGIGRGARGSGDYCVVLLAGSDLAGWIAKDANFKFLTNATRAQLEIGADISKEVTDLNDLAQTMKRSFNRDADWVEYHAETLADLVDEVVLDKVRIIQVSVERKAFNLWQDGHPEKAIAKINNILATSRSIDSQSFGWMLQLAARIAHHWGNSERAETLQQQAYGYNRNLIRPKTLPAYRRIDAPGEQAKSIINQLGEYRLRRGFLQTFDETVTFLHGGSSANQFEQALTALGLMIGFSSERHDENGVGPDVLWLLPSKQGLIIEAKSRKKEKNALTKEQHGQLLVAAEWFKSNYNEYECIRVSVHPKNTATKAAVAGASFALTYSSLARLISDARVLLSSLCESQLSGGNLIIECERLLAESTLKSESLVENYLIPFIND
jgi:replicative superfamily II helicase